MESFPNGAFRTTKEEIHHLKILIRKETTRVASLFEDADWSKAEQTKARVERKDKRVKMTALKIAEVTEKQIPGPQPIIYSTCLFDIWLSSDGVLLVGDAPHLADVSMFIAGEMGDYSGLSSGVTLYRVSWLKRILKSLELIVEPHCMTLDVSDHNASLLLERIEQYKEALHAEEQRIIELFAQHADWSKAEKKSYSKKTCFGLFSKKAKMALLPIARTATAEYAILLRKQGGLYTVRQEYVQRYKEGDLTTLHTSPLRSDLYWVGFSFNEEEDPPGLLFTRAVVLGSILEAVQKIQSPQGISISH